MLIQKLKIILQSNYFLIFLILITFIYVFLIIKNEFYKTNYKVNDNIIIGYIDKLNIDGNKLTLTIKAKEKVIVNYYIKNKEEMKKISKYKLGDKLNVKGTFSEPIKNTNFNLFNYKKYLLSQKIYWVVSADKINKISNNKRFIYKIKNFIFNRINNIKKSKNYLEIFILGDNTNLDSNIKISYQNNGISHLFSISGMHVGVISGIILFLLNKFFKNKSINTIIVCLFLLFYMLLIGFKASIVRATLFFILININKKIKIKTLNLFIILTMIMLIINPYNIYDSAFLFSYSISFSLILLNKKTSNKNTYIKKILYISYISFLVSFPILINNYFSINLLSIFNNLLFVPLVSIIIFPVSLITFIFPIFDNFLYILLHFMEQLSLFLNNIKYFTFIMSKPNIIVIVLYYIIIFLILIKEKFIYKLIFIIMVLIHINYNYINSKFFVTFLDVGQGDSSLMLFPHNKGSILIDTGGTVNYYTEDWKKRKNEYKIVTSIIVPYLKSIGIKKLDYLVLTHGDYDHMGEAINLVNNFKVDKVIFNCGEYNDLEKELIKVLDRKNINYYSGIKELNIDKYKLQFLNTGEYDNENDNSNIIYTEINNYKFMLMGDAGIEREKDILNKYNLETIDFLKVGHHGSDTSSSKEFINSINPKYSLISVGKNNRYGHPKDSILEILRNSKIYRTDQDGSIEIKLNKNGYKIRTCSP